MADGSLADPAELAFASVNKKALGEVAGLAVGVDEVAEGGAALLDGFAEDLADGFDEAGELRAGKSGCGSGRADAGAEERFAGVDVANADDDLVVHDDLLDRSLASGAGVFEDGGRELVGQRLGS